MEQVEMERNARRLYSILAYTPKERKEERDEYNSSDLELATDLCLDGISLDEDHKCKVTDFEICGINE